LTLDSTQLQTFLMTRRSVRKFEKRPIPHKTLLRILKSGSMSPSAHNRQPWRFAVIQDDEIKERLANVMGDPFQRDLLADGLSLEKAIEQVARSKYRMLNAPVLLILCLSMEDMDTYQDDRRQRFEHQMAVQSVALAGGTILLAAHAEGLAGVWICAPLFAQEIVRDELSLPSDWEPQGMLLLGYPANIPEPRIRKSVEEVTYFVGTACIEK